MSQLHVTHADGSRAIRLPEGAKVLYLTKDPELIKQQLAGELVLRMEDVDPADLLDDINTDVMTPAWVCFRHRPEDIALDAYAGLLDANGERVFGTRALMDGGFSIIVSGQRKGTGSSRETAPQCEKWSGIELVIASSFAPIHQRNNINLGQLMGDYKQLARLEAGEEIALEEFTKSFDPVTATMLAAGGLFAFNKAYEAGELHVPAPTTAARPMTMGEKILHRHLHLESGQTAAAVKPGDQGLFNVDAGYSHEFTTAQVHDFLSAEFGADYTVKNKDTFAVFEDHLLYADGVAKMAPFASEIQTLRDLQVAFQRHTGVRDYSAKDGVSPGICHQVARSEFLTPGMFVQATDSHTCMGGASNCLAYGVGATEYAGLIQSGYTFVRVPESIRFELVGELPANVTAKDVILYILENYAVAEDTLDRVMEFGGPGMTTMAVDERATLTNMATECTGKSGICEGDERLAKWLERRGVMPGKSVAEIMETFVAPDPGAHYDGGVHTIDLSAIVPMVAKPGDPTYGEDITDLGEVAIDIAYGGSCTAGKDTDMDLYASVLAEAEKAGRGLAEGVNMYIQYGSEGVRDYALEVGYDALFRRLGVTMIGPGCGACIGCGPGVSETSEQVTVSAINRNFQGRSGPGKLYLASPLTVAASAVTGRITAFESGMFDSTPATETVSTATSQDNDQ
ncbi:MAG: aconitase family protein [Planctomycetota bacterium]|nr:aconitase family protein [Planctomycetota bacterium]